MLYAFHENFVLPLSHDEVVHGKGSLLGKMPGDDWQKFANLRLLLGYMWAQPGKKLLFMGGEFGQWREWNHEASLDWHLLAVPAARGRARAGCADLNRLYRSEPALHELDCDPAGFEWIDCNDWRRERAHLPAPGRDGRRAVLVALQLHAACRGYNYRVGVPRGGNWRELLNSDAAAYGGSGQGNCGGVDAEPIPDHGRPFSLNLTLPPLGAVFLKGEAPQA